MRQPQKPRGTKSQDDGLAEAGDPSGSFCPPPPGPPTAQQPAPHLGPSWSSPRSRALSTQPFLRSDLSRCSQHPKSVPITPELFPSRTEDPEPEEERRKLRSTATTEGIQR